MMLARTLRVPIFCAMTSVALLLFAATAGAISIDQVTSPTKITSQTVTGTIVAGALVTVQCPSATVDPVSYPTESSWTVLITGLSEGNNSVTATTDIGFPSSVTTVIVVDTHTPTLTVSSLPNGAVTNNQTLNVSGYAIDGTGSGVASVTINGHIATLKDDGSFSYALPLSVGANNVTTTAIDAAGNSTQDTRVVTLDQSKPQIDINSPADNIATSQSPVTVTGTVDKNAQVAFSVNGGSPQAAMMSDLSFTADAYLAEGLNTITITATDQAANSSDAKRTIVYDTTKPTVQIQDPPQDIATNHSSFTIKGTVSDTLSAVTVTVAVDGVTLTPPVNNGAFEQLIVFDANKNYQITATATDAAGNETIVTRNIIYDNVSPTITGASSTTAAGHYGVGRSINVTLAFSKPVISEGLTILLSSGATITSGSLSGVSSYSGTSVVADGENTELLTITSVNGTLADSVGNQNTKPSVPVGNNIGNGVAIAVDTTPPLASAGPNQTRNALFFQTATASDATALTYQWTKQSGPGTITFGSPTALVTTISAGTDGIYVLRLTATDAAGNSSYGEMTLTWDTTVPSINAGGNKTANAAFTQTATASDATALTYQWTQQPGAGPGTITFASPTALVTMISANSDGIYVLRITATDAVGNSSFGEMTLTWDTGKPFVSAGASSAHNATYTQVASASDPLGMTFSWSFTSGTGAIVFGSPGALSTTVTADKEGVYTLVITATDTAGNIASSAATLTWDLTAPALAITMIPNNSSISEAVLPISGTVSDPLSGVQSFKINGVDVPLDVNGAFNYSVAPAVGANVITMAASDFAGNTSYDVRTVILDPAAPTITISSPGSEYKTNHPGVTVTGTVDKQCSIAIHVSGDGLDRSFSNVPVSGNIFTLQIDGLAVGRNTIDVVATSSANLQSTKSVTVTYDTQKPLLDVTSPAGDVRATQASIVISGSTSDSQTGVSVTITKDLEAYRPQVVNGSFSQIIPLAEKKVYIIAVTATDEAGNESTITRRVIYATSTGDINGDGDVNVADALLALQVSVGMRPQLDSYLVNGDVGPLKNGLPAPDWKIDISDVVLILRISAKNLKL